MINCEVCGTSLEAGKVRLPIWGVPTVSNAGLKSHYFCSKEHGDIWIEKHPDYKKWYGVQINESNPTD